MKKDTEPEETLEQPSMAPEPVFDGFDDADEATEDVEPPKPVLAKKLAPVKEKKAPAQKVVKPKVEQITPVEESHFAQSKTTAKVTTKAKTQVKQDDAAAEEKTEGGEEAEEAKAEPKGASDANEYAIDDPEPVRFGRGNWRHDAVEHADDLNFGEEDAVKDHPKYKSMMKQILGRNWNYKDEDNTHYGWRNHGYGWGRGVDRYPFDGHGGKDKNGRSWFRNNGIGGGDPEEAEDEATEDAGEGEAAEGEAAEGEAAEGDTTPEDKEHGWFGHWERRDGWEGKGNKHGEYDKYDPYVETDGDDKEHEGYYPADHETEEREYLRDLYHNNYQENWNYRSRGWRNTNPY